MNGGPWTRALQQPCISVRQGQVGRGFGVKVGVGYSGANGCSCSLPEHLSSTSCLAGSWTRTWGWGDHATSKVTFMVGRGTCSLSAS